MSQSVADDRESPRPEQHGHQTVLIRSVLLVQEPRAQYLFRKLASIHTAIDVMNSSDSSAHHHLDVGEGTMGEQPRQEGDVG